MKYFSFCPFLILFVLLTLSVKGQNLIPNPSFEDTIQCPQFYGDIDASCEYWTSFKGSADYMHNCFPGVANDLAGGKMPHTGEAYAGFITYGITTPDFGREHLAVELLEPLIIGEKYYVSFYASVGYTPLTHNIATNNVGIMFTTYVYSDLMLEIPNINFSHINETSIISESETWVQVSGSFVADSAYNYMVIGNFYDDEYTDTLNLPFIFVSQRAYYCVDDVCVSTDSLYTDTWLGINENRFLKNSVSIYPNPASDYLKIVSDLPIDMITLYNNMGRKIKEIKLQNVNTAEININYLNSGLYFVQIDSKNSTIVEKIIINQ